MSSSMAQSIGESGEEQSTAGDPDLSEDLLFDILSSKRRREALRYLDRTGGRTEFADVTEAVAISEGISEDASPSEYKHVYVALYQSHVPKLEDAGVVDYDRDEQTLALTEHADRLIAYLNFSPSQRQPDVLTRLTRRLM